jgi:F-type H+-transporting ATPase subunit epsilon
MAMQVELVSPEAIVWSGEANMVIARTLEGDAAFMEGHIPMIGALATGIVRVIADGEPERQIAVHSGFVEVTPTDGGATKVAVLSDMAELAEDIDLKPGPRAPRIAPRRPCGPTPTTRWPRPPCVAPRCASWSPRPLPSANCQPETRTLPLSRALRRSSDRVRSVSCRPCGVGTPRARHYGGLHGHRTDHDRRNLRARWG